MEPQAVQAASAARELAARIDPPTWAAMFEQHCDRLVAAAHQAGLLNLPDAGAHDLLRRLIKHELATYSKETLARLADAAPAGPAPAGASPPPLAVARTADGLQTFEAAGIRFRRDGHIGVLTLDRPPVNSFTDDMGRAIRALVPEVNADPQVRCLIVEGAGPHFSPGGGDPEFLAALTRRDWPGHERWAEEFFRNFLSLQEVEVPTIALLKGQAKGAGLAVALACDFRYAAVDAQMSVPFVKLNLGLGMGLSWNLARLVGLPKATDLLLTGRDIAPDEALACGLVHAVRPVEQLAQAGWQLAEQLAANGPQAMRSAKALLRRNVGADLNAALPALQAEAMAQASSAVSQDFREGMASFAQGRPPVFRGT